MDGGVQIAQRHIGMKIVESKIKTIVALCKHYKVKTLYLFGSILTTRFRQDSDIDFLVKFDKDNIHLADYADNFFDFQYVCIGGSLRKKNRFSL